MGVVGKLQDKQNDQLGSLPGGSEAPQWHSPEHCLALQPHLYSGSSYCRKGSPIGNVTKAGDTGAQAGLLQAPASRPQREAGECVPGRLHPGGEGWGLGMLGLPCRQNRWLLLDEGTLQSLTDPRTHAHVHRTGSCRRKGLVRPYKRALLSSRLTD